MAKLQGSRFLTEEHSRKFRHGQIAILLLKGCGMEAVAHARFFEVATSGQPEQKRINGP